MLNILLFIFNSLFCSCGLILLKKSFIEKSISNHTYLDLIYNSKFLLGFIMYVGSFFLWLFLLSRLNLNIAFPINMSLIFILSTFGSYYFLNENINTLHLFGITFCALGIIMINYSLK